MEVRRINNDELYHHGVKGQRWGVRRYQNEDGTLTPKGKAKLEKLRNKDIKYLESRLNRIRKDEDKNAKFSEHRAEKLLKKSEKLESEGKDAEKILKKFDKRMEQSNNIRKDFTEYRKKLQKEIDIVKNYTLSDYKKEKAEYWKYAQKYANTYAIRHIGMNSYRTLETTSVRDQVRSEIRKDFANDKKAYGKSMTRKERNYRNKAEYTLDKDKAEKYRKKYEKEKAKNDKKYG